MPKFGKSFRKWNFKKNGFGSNRFKKSKSNYRFVGWKACYATSPIMNPVTVLLNNHLDNTRSKRYYSSLTVDVMTVGDPAIFIAVSPVALNPTQILMRAILPKVGTASFYLDLKAFCKTQSVENRVNQDLYLYLLGPKEGSVIFRVHCVLKEKVKYDVSILDRVYRPGVDGSLGLVNYGDELDLSLEYEQRRIARENERLRQQNQPQNVTGLQPHGLGLLGNQR